MTRNYVVLRDLNADLPQPPRRHGPRRVSTSSNTRPEPKLAVETHKVSRHEAAEMETEKNVRAVAEEMPIRLIKPVPRGAGAGLADAGISRESGNAWGVDAVGATQSVFDGKTSVVAVLDTGIRSDHEAFDGIDLVKKDFSNSGTVEDSDGHGTHCAGTIFGRDVKGVRIGVARGVKKALIGRVFGDGILTSHKLVEAIQWAVNENADVISMSLGFDFAGLAADYQKFDHMPPEAAFSQALFEFQRNLRLFDTLADQIRVREEFPGMSGSVVVCASGNASNRSGDAGGANSYTVPAEVPSNAIQSLSVGALQRTDLQLDIAEFSNTHPDLVAPGVDIVSAGIARRTELVADSGTSMACPHVAGIAALWWDKLRADNERVVAEEIKEKLRTTASTEDFVIGLGKDDVGKVLAVAP